MFKLEFINIIISFSILQQYLNNFLLNLIILGLTYLALNYFYVKNRP